MAEVCCCPRESIRRTYGSNDQNAQASFPHHNQSSRYVKGTCEETIQHGSLIDNLKNNKSLNTLKTLITVHSRTLEYENKLFLKTVTNVSVFYSYLF